MSDSPEVAAKPSKLKRMLKKKRFWAIAVVVLIIVISVLAKMGGGNTIQYSTEDVKRGTLEQTVTATGAVEAAEDISLNFKNSGRLVTVKVKEGDVVKRGTLLAAIDSSALSAQVRQAQANLASAQANLDKIKAGASAEDVQVTNEQVRKAEADLANLKTESSEQLTIYREKTLDSLTAGVFAAQVGLDKIWTNFFDGETAKNIQFLNNSLQGYIYDHYLNLKSDLVNVGPMVTEAKNTKNQDKIVQAAEGVRAILAELGTVLNDCYALSDQIVINAYYSQTTKDTIKADFNTQQTANGTALTSLQTAKANLVNGATSYATQIQAAENNLAIYRAQLDLKTAGPRDFEIKSAEASVLQARAQLDQASANLADYSIVAPIDGTITKVNFKIGEQTSMSEPAVRMLSTEKYQIKVDISESDIAKVKTGDKVTITLDAFGSDQLFSGSVSFIDPAQTTIQDVIYYRTTVSFDQNDLNKQLKPGMTADVTIATAQKTDVLYIPQRAVKVAEAVLGEVPKKTVRILINGQPEEREVVIGLRGDNGLVEVVSGLNESEKVITFEKNGK